MDSCFHIVYPKFSCYHANVTAEIKVLSDQVMFLHVGKEDQQFLKYPGPCNTSNHGTVFMPQCTELPLTPQLVVAGWWGLPLHEFCAGGGLKWLSINTTEYTELTKTCCTCKHDINILIQRRRNLVRSSVLPLLEEGEADADGHVVDTQRNGVSLLWTVLKTEIKKKKKYS